MASLHLVNLGVVASWTRYFGASFDTPFGTRVLPMYYVVPIVVTLVCCHPLVGSRGLLERQLPRAASGGLGWFRLAVALSLMGVDLIALGALTGAVFVALPLMGFTCGVLSVLALGEWYWVAVCGAFIAALPWAISEKGTETITAACLSDVARGCALILVAGTCVVYVRLQTARRLLRRPPRLE